MKNNYIYKTTLALVLIAATSLHLNANNGILVSPKMFLKGALTSSGLMRDDLRAKGLLPSTEPYSALPNFQHFGGGGETITSPSVFAVTGNDAIVDWVVVEVRSDANLSIPVATRSALLQRDGDVVATDGVSPVRFLNVAPGQYHVSVRHRNHLGAMTAGNFSLSNVTALIDFSSPAVPLYGTNPVATVGNFRALWLGDTNSDKKLIIQGPANDIDQIFFLVLQAPANTNLSLNFILYGYSNYDCNLDGEVTFAGPHNDRGIIWQQFLENCSGGCAFAEQIPN